MKKITYYFIIAILCSQCSTFRADLPTLLCEDTNINNGSLANEKEIQDRIDELTKIGIPGVAIAIYQNGTWWEYSSGFAKIEDQTPMLSCHLHYLQSIAKTYMAVAVLQLYEQGKIDLEAPFLQYLPANQQAYLSMAQGITVRMLLEHTSGLPEYNMDPVYISDLVQHPERDFTPIDYLSYIQNKDLQFTPGSRYRYTNLNYEILALMVDHITGDHAQFISENIFQVLNLEATFYAHEANYLNYPEIYNSYWDRYGDGLIENVSRWQRQNVSDMVGDDGIVATPRDAVLFLRGLMEGNLIKPSTLELMKEGFKNAEGVINYGLGLDLGDFVGHLGFGHSGGGLGAGCQLYYFPDRDLYCFFGINIGTITDSPILEPALEKVDSIYQLILD